MSIAPDFACYNVSRASFSLMECFEPYENVQIPYRILDPEFRDPGRIFDIFVEILVRLRTSEVKGGYQPNRMQQK